MHLFYAFCLTATLSSCSTVGFYSQALKGQSEIMRKARPVAEVLADPTSPPKVKEKLTTVNGMLDYAEDILKLPAEGQYRKYANLGRRHVVWVVFAAPEFSLQARQWWYPLVGTVKYRGFFEESLAQAEAEKLRGEGMDVYVGGVEAYSTLGYLKDPLLNTFLGRNDASLAELIFHELTHQRIYLAGDTDFNEALATVVGREGTRRWLHAQGRHADLARYEKELQVEKQFVDEVLATRQELEVLYKQTFGSQEEKRLAKQKAFQNLKRRLQAMNRRHGGSLKIDRWFEKPVNNARLNTLATYYDLVPDFEAVLKECGGDIPLFLSRMEELKPLTQMERRARIHLRPTP